LARQATRVTLAALAVALTLGAPIARGGTWVTHLYMNDVRDLAVTDGGVWCATTGGALFYDTALGEFRAWNRTADGLASDTLTAAAALSDGRIAFGTDRTGLALYDPATGIWFHETSRTTQIAGDAIVFISEAPPWRIIGSRPTGTTAGGFVALRDGQVRETCQQGLDPCGVPGWAISAGIEYQGALWLGAQPGEGLPGGVGRLQYATSGNWDTPNTGLPSRLVVGFAVWDGALYCATRAGVSVWDGTNWVDRRAGLPAEASVCALRAGPTRLLLAASGVGGGVFSWNGAGGTWDRLGTLQAHCVSEAADGTVWAGASPDQSGRVWLDADEDGLWECVGGQWAQHRQPGPHPVGSYTALTVDADGRLWAATAGRLRGWRIARYQPGSWDFFDAGNVPGMNDAWVFDLRATAAGLFVGHCCCNAATGPCHMNVWDQATGEVAVNDSVFNITDSDTDGADRIWFASLYEAATGEGVARGIYRYDTATGEWTHYTNESTDGLLISNKVAAVDLEGGYLWIGYYNQGLGRCRLRSDGLPSLQSATWAHYTADSIDSRLLSNGVRAIASRPGQVWIGTTGGVTLWENGRWRLLRPSSFGLPGSEVTDIALTTDGAAWIGIRGQGVTRVTEEQSGAFHYERFGPPELVSPAVTVLATGAQGRDLWVGTEAGLSHFLAGGEETATQTRDVRVYPNPYNPGCPDSLRLLALPGRAAEGTICDPAGRIVARFHGRWAGDTIWDGRDRHGRVVAPGLYLIRLSTPRGWLTGRVAVLDLPCSP
jgi:ligand-binding sensor domain-containing protein